MKLYCLSTVFTLHSVFLD